MKISCLNNNIKRIIFAFDFLLLFSLIACSNKPIGQELSDSFNSSKTSNISEIKQLKNEKVKNTPISNKDLKPTNIVESSRKKRFINSSKSKTFNDDLTRDKFVPQPYRIMIKLSGANPSAPAETVTKALRKSGIIFEVEKIERISDNNQEKKILMPVNSPLRRR